MPPAFRLTGAPSTPHEIEIEAVLTVREAMYDSAEFTL
jgi:hypothetical protein